MSRINRRTFLATTALAAAGCISRRNVPSSQPPAESPVESPDRRSDPHYLEHSIKNISDEDLFAALDLSSPNLKKVREAAASKDYPAGYAAWGEYWQTVSPSRRRFVGEDGLLMSRAQIVKSLEPRRAQTIRDADVIVAHKITGWGDVTIQHGPVVDFNADYGRSGKYGFNYWVWSRKLIDGYLLTNDAKYLNSFEELFDQWYEQRNRIHGEIPDLDVVYYELGLGNRCRPFLEFYCSAKPQAATHEHMLKTMLGSARWLYGEEKRKYRGGNWQIMGSFGLAWIGAQISEFEDAAKWVTLGGTRIAQHVEADFFPDGCHSERVPSSYMLVAYRDPRNLAMLLADRKEYSELSKRIRPKLKRTLEWYFAMMPPDWIIPGINDGSRAPMPGALSDDARDLFAMETGIRDSSIHYPASGFTAMRTDASKDALYMLINHGPSGGGHSHSDSLDFELHAYGQAMAIDSGIGRTYDDPQQGPWYIRTRAHNTVMVDGDDLNRKESEGRDVVWTSLKTFDLFAATHLGYLANKGITHRRHIAFVKPLYWIVYDIIDSKSDKAHTISRNLHSPSSRLIVHKAYDWRRSESAGPASVRGIRGFEGKDYADIPWIAFEQTVNAGERAAQGVLLFPAKDDQASADLSIVKQDGASAHFVVNHPGGTDHVLFGPIDSDDIHFTGAAGTIRYRAGAATSFAAAKSLSLSVGGNKLLDSTTLRDLEGNF